jgi:MoxR-like ATPase
MDEHDRLEALYRERVLPPTCRTSWPGSGTREAAGRGRPALQLRDARVGRLIPPGRGRILQSMKDFASFHGTDRYLTDRALEAAVNCALALERPLLVKGEPGTGKTLLAEAIAEALGLPLLSWTVKSTTRAQDGLYVYDTVQRLYDARFGEGDTKDIGRYIRLGPLGRAFSAPSRVVLLIDEIDKADLEFPNDLLEELDRMRFRVMETGEEVAARERPVVIITSNNEKELPDAFLRRCVFHFIDFPDADLMARILEVHHPGLDARLAEQALGAFYRIRSVAHLRKRPSTSELIDWIAVLRQSGVAELRFDGDLPFLGTLLKKEQDHALFAAAVRKS